MISVRRPRSSAGSSERGDSDDGWRGWRRCGWARSCSGCWSETLLENKDRRASSAVSGVRSERLRRLLALHLRRGVSFFDGATEQCSVVCRSVPLFFNRLHRTRPVSLPKAFRAASQPRPRSHNATADCSRIRSPPRKYPQSPPPSQRTARARPGRCTRSGHALEGSKPLLMRPIRPGGGRQACKRRRGGPRAAGWRPSAPQSGPSPGPHTRLRASHPPRRALVGVDGCRRISCRPVTRAQRSPRCSLAPSPKGATARLWPHAW